MTYYTKHDDDQLIRHAHLVRNRTDLESELLARLEALRDAHEPYDELIKVLDDEPTVTPDRLREALKFAAQNADLDEAENIMDTLGYWGIYTCDPLKQVLNRHDKIVNILGDEDHPDRDAFIRVFSE